MKHFITAISQQPAKYLKQSVYASADPQNSIITSDRAVSFPILIPLENATENGESIHLTVILPQHENVTTNYQTFQKELKEITDTKNLTCEIDEIKIPYSEDVDTHLNMFEHLIEQVRDDDLLYVCLTYGTKPVPMVMQTTLNFAYKLRKNCSIESIVYGQVDHNENKLKIYDVSSLFYLNSVINSMSSINAKNPVEYIKTMLKFTSPQTERGDFV